jgi:hypothetical protein
MTATAADAGIEAATAAFICISLRPVVRLRPGHTSHLGAEPMSSSRGLPKLFAAAALGAMLAAGVAVPAAAQGFSAKAQGMFFGFGDDGEAERTSRRLCLPTDAGLRTAIADQGYEDIYLNVPVGRLLQARASRDEWVYLLTVDVCTGDVVERERLRRR